MVFLEHMRIMAALECVTGSVSWVQYLTADFKDHVELLDNALI